MRNDLELFIDTFGISIDSFIVPIIIYFFETPSYLLKVNHLFTERAYTLALVLHLYFCHPTLRAQPLITLASAVNQDEFLKNFPYDDNRLVVLNCTNSRAP